MSIPVMGGQKENFMVEWIKENRKNLFIAAFTVYLAELILFDSMYGKIQALQKIFAMIRVSCYALVCAKLALDFFMKKFSLKELIFIGAGTAFLILIVLTSGNKAILIYWTFIIASHDTEFERLIRISFWVHLCCLVFVIGSSYGGVIENRIYEIWRNKVLYRQSLGFQYTTESSNYFFYMILMAVYIRKDKITWWELAALAAGDVYFFYMTKTRSAFLLSSAALCCAIALKLVRWLREYKAWYTAVAVGVVPAFSSFIIWSCIHFDTQIPWMLKLNNLTSSRLYLGNAAYVQYGFHPLGQKIKWYGATIWMDGVNAAYNYVDSSYMQYLLSFGWIFFAVLVAFFVFLGLRIGQKKDVYFVFALGFFALHSMLDPQLLLMAYNTFVMAYAYLKSGKGESAMRIHPASK